MKPESVTHFVKHGADDPFRRGIPIADPRHAATSLLWGQDIRHEFGLPHRARAIFLVRRRELDR
jgi:hypothetical protein